MNILEMAKTAGNALPEKYKTMTKEEMENRVHDIKKRLGNRTLYPRSSLSTGGSHSIFGLTGDSLQLAQLSAENREADYIVFCGVHFMAETADILTEEGQTVILPDMRAGCSMADMADIEQTERAWTKLQDIFGDTILPLTYVNSTAAIKAFVGKNGGATVTSSNAQGMVSVGPLAKRRILFLPDQHLGRNTAFDLGIPLNEMAVWDPHKDELIYEGELEDLKVLLWKGHCSVHENFTTANIETLRAEQPEMNIIVHPECRREVVALSDYAGSTSYIINMIEKAEPGSSWAIGTEMNLVKRLIANNPDKNIISLNPNMCPCLTMNRIDLPHLLWALESIEEGIIINPIKVEKNIADNAILALNRMLERV